MKLLNHFVLKMAPLILKSNPNDSTIKFAEHSRTRNNMPKPRSQQISLSSTPYYHCITRCVRRAFLCGKDVQSGQCYEHRRAWVEDRLLLLGTIFAIDVCAFSVMSNHTHVILHIDENTAKLWSTEEVLHHWHQLFSGTLFTQQYSSGEKLSKEINNCVHETAEIYRKRLMDISWFMRALNEPIARQANTEDNCTGKFWEGRFKIQALLDEVALAACLVYVDLNPVRAKMAKTPETSVHTSILLRTKSAQKGEQPATLFPFAGNPKKEMPKGLPLKLEDYIQLVELTGRCIHQNKRGFIDNALPPILSRLNITPENWLKLATKFEYYFKGAVGSPNSISKFCNHKELKRRHNIASSNKLYNFS